MRHLFVQKDEEKNIVVCGYVDVSKQSTTQGSWTIYKRIDPNNRTILNSYGYELKWDANEEKMWRLNHIYPIERKYFKYIFKEIFDV
jgi:hypothetical protein